MPKKHHTDYTKQAQAHNNRPSSPIVNDGAGTGSSSASSVNQRLEQLRREQAPKPTAEHRNAVSAVVSSPTLPPNVRHILAIPETAPPQQRRRPIRQRRDPPSVNGYTGRAPAGPAAPLSWLHSSRHAPRHLRRVDENGQLALSTSTRGVRRATGRYNLSAMDPELPDLPRPGSLMDTAMKTFARNWEELVEYEQLNLATLSAHLKATLLSYAALYGPDDGITIGDMKTLFWNDSELEHATGSKELEVLDLSGLVGYPGSLSLPELHRYWNSAKSRHDPAKSQDSTRDSTLDDSLESWEDAQDSDNSASSIPKAIHSRFPHVTVLSLSNPSPTVSWSHLLSFSQHLTTLTHLSLAYWPTPSLTPNARTAVVQSQHGNVSLGATNIYSAMDDDWHEAASILRRFSNNTYRLQCLDLEGCNSWLAALVWTDSTEPSDQWATDRMRHITLSPTAVHDGLEAAQSGPSEGPGWNTSWAQLIHINVSQGWIPYDTAAVRALPSGSLQIQLLNYLRSRGSQGHRERARSKVMDIFSRAIQSEDLGPYQVKRWLEKEKEARRVVGTIRALRSTAGGKWIEFEHGWDPNATRDAGDVDTPDIAVEASRRAMNSAVGVAV